MGAKGGIRAEKKEQSLKISTYNVWRGREGRVGMKGEGDCGVS